MLRTRRGIYLWPQELKHDETKDAIAVEHCSLVAMYSSFGSASPRKRQPFRG